MDENLGLTEAYNKFQNKNANIPPKGVSFSDFIRTFAMSFRILFVITTLR